MREKLACVWLNVKYLQGKQAYAAKQKARLQQAAAAAIASSASNGGNALTNGHSNGHANGTSKKRQWAQEGLQKKKKRR